MPLEAKEAPLKDKAIFFIGSQKKLDGLRTSLREQNAMPETLLYSHQNDTWGQYYLNLQDGIVKEINELPKKPDAVVIMFPDLDVCDADTKGYKGADALLPLLQKLKEMGIKTIVGDIASDAFSKNEKIKSASSAFVSAPRDRDYEVLENTPGALLQLFAPAAALAK